MNPNTPTAAVVAPAQAESARTPALRRDRSGLWLTLILLLSVGVFAPTLLNGFTYDDPHYARTTTPTGDRNPMVADLRPFVDYWRRPMNWGLPSNCRGFRPVTVYSYALINDWAADPQSPEHHKGEDRAWAQHLLNLLLHAMATLGVFLLLRSWAGSWASRPAALIGTLVFGVHALHSGPVAAIVGRAELLAFLGGCTAALVYRVGLRRRGARRGLAVGATAAALLVGLGGKESALAWVAFIPLLGHATGHGWRTQRWPALLGIALPALLFLWLRHDMLVTHVEPRGPFWVEHDANPLYYLPPLERIVNATCILVYGLAKVCLPCNMSSNYGDGPFTLIQSVFHWRFLGASLLLVALAVGGWRVRRRHPLLFLATAAGLGFSFITSNIPLPIETIFGDRLYYTAVLGLSFGTAWLAQRITLARQFTSTCRIAAVAVLVAWTGWNCVAGFERGRAWYDNMSLTKSDLRSQPDSVGLHVDMGNLHLWNFDPESGLLEFRRALALNPQSPRALRFLAENTKDEGDARRLLQRALASPFLVPATEGRRIHWALGNLHDKAGDPAAARAAYLEALACNPYVPDIRLHLLRDTANAGEWDLFTELLDEGRRLVPDYPPLELYHGVALHHAQAFDAAAAVFARVLPELPEQVHVVESWFRYADCLLHLGEAAGARAIALRFQRRAGKHPTLRAGCDELLQRTATARPPR